MRIDLSRTECSDLIDEWILHERDREIMKRRLLDAITYERLAEEFNMSIRGIQYVVDRNRKILLKHLPK